MVLELTPDDCKKLEEKYPLLNCDLKNQKVWGTFKFTCYYDAENKELVHDNQSENTLSDTYEIEINFQDPDFLDLPKVFETSGKIISFAEKEKKSINDLHLFNDFSCCLGVEYDYEWIDVCKFIDDRITSFFFWQTYLKKYGKEPWEGYEHGLIGRVNGGLDSIKRIDKKIYEKIVRAKGKNRNRPCFCGSKIKYKNCCLSKDKRLIKKLKEKRKVMIQKIREEIEDSKSK